MEKTAAAVTPVDLDETVQTFRGEWDEEGVFFYQAYNDDIAAWAIANQKFGGPHFRPLRMTWIKPSFAWVCFRSRYASKHNQTRILKIKLSHESVAMLLSQCKCSHGGGGSWGRVQWDPERDIMAGDGNEPRRMLRTRAIQIGLKGHLSKMFVESIIYIEDVTELARKLGEAHRLDYERKSKTKEAVAAILDELPHEKPYLPSCSSEVLEALGMVPGETALAMSGLGRGHVGSKRIH